MYLYDKKSRHHNDHAEHWSLPPSWSSSNVIHFALTDQRACLPWSHQPWCVHLGHDFSHVLDAHVGPNLVCGGSEFRCWRVSWSIVRCSLHLHAIHDAHSLVAKISDRTCRMFRAACTAMASQLRRRRSFDSVPRWRRSRISCRRTCAKFWDCRNMAMMLDGGRCLVKGKVSSGKSLSISAKTQKTPMISFCSYFVFCTLCNAAFRYPSLCVHEYLNVRTSPEDGCRDSRVEFL